MNVQLSFCGRVLNLFTLLLICASCGPGPRVETSEIIPVSDESAVVDFQDGSRPRSGFEDTLHIWLKYRIDGRLVGGREEYENGFERGYAGPPGLVDGSADFNLGHSDGMRARMGQLGPESDSLLHLERQLESGTPAEKEEVLDFFMREYPVELIPDVIEAILDGTESPRHGDTGWARIHHQAATAMADFARRVDGMTLVERGRFKYSFYDDGGVGTGERCREVYSNWLEWWRENKAVIIQSVSDGKMRQ